MFDKKYLLPQDALKLILDSLSGYRLPVERLKIEDCYDRISASDIYSTEDLPAFTRSTVDGFAVNSADTFGAKESSPAYISVKHEILMGAVPDFTISKGEAAKIPTGGMLPQGADAALMLEYAQNVSDDMIEVLRPVAPGENLIQHGEDIKKGELVIAKGHRLRPQDIGALAGIGITTIEVFKKPSISIISTGDEIVPADSPLQLGQVRDINSFTLAGLINREGGIPLKKGIFKDEYETIKNAIQASIAESDMVLITGGTSAGTKDMAADIINNIGKAYGKGGVLFHGVSLRPGKPLIGGIINNKPVLGLPGHPAAVVVCFDLFIRPIMDRLSGLASNRFHTGTINARMAKNIASAAGREDHIRVFIEERDSGLFAVPVLGKSGLITTLVRADGVVVISEGKLGLDAGEEVTVKLF